LLRKATSCFGFSANVKESCVLSGAAALDEDLGLEVDAAMASEPCINTLGRMLLQRRLGLKHPQRARSARRAQEPRLPVESDRVRKVLSAISDSGALRIKDVTETLQIPHQSINALMQYLKRKHLVEKTGQDLHAPYSLTETGHAA
jgi:predicted transcriptional regulator